MLRHLAVFAVGSVGLVFSGCNDGSTSGKDGSVVILDTSPMVTLVASRTSVTTAGEVSLVAAAVDDSSIAKVEFYEGTTKLSEAAAPPYVHVLTFAASDNGTHTYTAKAYDSGSKSSTSAAVTVTVAITSGASGGGSGTGGGAGTGGGSAGGGSGPDGGGTGTDSTPPTVSLKANFNTVSTPQSVNVTATANDNVGIAKVELYDGFTKLRELTAPTVNSDYVFTFNYTTTDNGTHRYLARAYDAAANYATSTVAQVNVLIPAASAIRELAPGFGFTWLLKEDDTLYVTGSNPYQTTGGNNYATFTLFPGVTAHHIGAMPASNTLLFGLIDNSLAAIGSNGYGLGFAGAASQGFSVVTPSNPLQTNVKYVRGGEYTSCYIRNDNTIWCAGYDYLGGGASGGSPNATEVLFIDGGVFTNAVSITLGYEGRAILRADGTVWSFGRGDLGQGELGDGTSQNRGGAVQVIYPSLTPVINATQVASSRGAGYAVLDGGTVVAWGSNTSGMLGDNSNVTSRNTATAVYALTGITRIAAGYDHVLALDDQGNVWAWGSNQYSQLGTSTVGTSSNVAVQVTGITNVKEIYAGSYTSFALKQNGELWGWGGGGAGGVTALGINDAGFSPVTRPHRILIP